MGEAARRKSTIAALKAATGAWLTSLPPEARVVAEVAQRTYEQIVDGMGMTEGCYNLAFFLSEHLRRKHGIEVEIVVGWINDGEWDGATSHAWVEYQGKKVDISIHKTSHPVEQPSGDLIILDHVVKRGKVTYTYWPTLPDHAARALEEMGNSSPDLMAMITHKGKEHQRILSLAPTKEGAAEYFSDAPANRTYEYLARLVG